MSSAIIFKSSSWYSNLIPKKKKWDLFYFLNLIITLVWSGLSLMSNFFKNQIKLGSNSQLKGLMYLDVKYSMEKFFYLHCTLLKLTI